MTTTDRASSEPRQGHADDTTHIRRGGVGWLQADKYSGAYVALALIVIFSLIEPDTFRTWTNVRVIASNEAITATVTLGLVFTLAAGMFDLSIGGSMGLAAVLVVEFQQHGAPVWLAIALAILSGAAVGVVNGLIITRLSVDSLICTLGTGSILSALAFAVSGGRTLLVEGAPGFIRLGRGRVLGIPSTVLIMGAIALVVWFVLTHTPLGRRLYAVGGNPAAARLAGVQVRRLQVLALVVSGSVASIAGILLAAQLGSAPVDGGTPYLLPAFSAAFLGATQIRPGRFNAPGALVAIYLLGIGVKGLQLRYPNYPWIRSLFVGIALVTAVALAAQASRRRANS